MKTLYDVQQLLKRFGSFIYTGDRNTDLLLMEKELKELQQWGIVDVQTYQLAMLVIKRELHENISKNKK